MTITLANYTETLVSFCCVTATDTEDLIFNETDFTAGELSLLNDYINYQVYSSIEYVDKNEGMEIVIRTPLSVTPRSIIREYESETTENKTLIDDVVNLLVSKV